MIRRYNRDGRDVTEFPAMWHRSDCEVAITQYPNPSITTGQHTNGPASIWIRKIDGEWMRSRERTIWQTLKTFKDWGIEFFEMVDEEMKAREE